MAVRMGALYFRGADISPTNRGDAAGARVDSPTNRGDAAGARVDSPRSRGDAVGAAWIVRGDDERARACVLERRGQQTASAGVDSAVAATWIFRLRYFKAKETVGAATPLDEDDPREKEVRAIESWLNDEGAAAAAAATAAGAAAAADVTAVMMAAEALSVIATKLTGGEAPKPAELPAFGAERALPLLNDLVGYVGAAHDAIRGRDASRRTLAAAKQHLASVEAGAKRKAEAEAAKAEKARLAAAAEAEAAKVLSPRGIFL